MSLSNLQQYGSDHRVDAFENVSLYRLARVISLERDVYRVVTEEAMILAKLAGIFYYENRATIDFPTVGDWVGVKVENDFAVIHKVYKRSSVFERKAAGKTSSTQLIASNIDAVIICMSLTENFNLRRLERYLASAWASGAQPVLYLTKVDMTDAAIYWKQQAETVAIGVPILTGSDRIEGGFHDIDAFLEPQKTYAFVGSSGVGKSTIVNHLLGIHTEATSETGWHEKGRHTTTSRHLYVTPSGSIIIDTPGMREFGLDAIDLDVAFSDIEVLARKCKFADCLHNTEPNCAVRDAVELGIVSQERLDNYFKLQKEAEHHQRKAEEAEIKARRFAKRR